MTGLCYNRAFIEKRLNGKLLKTIVRTLSQDIDIKLLYTGIGKTVLKDIVRLQSLVISSEGSHRHSD